MSFFFNKPQRQPEKVAPNLNEGWDPAERYIREKNLRVDDGPTSLQKTKPLVEGFGNLSLGAARSSALNTQPRAQPNFSFTSTAPTQLGTPSISSSSSSCASVIINYDNVNQEDQERVPSNEHTSTTDSRTFSSSGSRACVVESKENTNEGPVNAEAVAKRLRAMQESNALNDVGDTESPVNEEERGAGGVGDVEAGVDSDSDSIPVGADATAMHEENLPPWGTRPLFSEVLHPQFGIEMCEVLPESTECYRDKVSRPIGCTFDAVTASFFATSKVGCGWVLEITVSGDTINLTNQCSQFKLISPGAVAIVEHNKSVAVVADNGIVLYTKVAPLGQGIEGMVDNPMDRKYCGRWVATFPGGRRGGPARGLTVTRERNVVTALDRDIVIYLNKEGVVGQILVKVPYKMTIMNSLHRGNVNPCFIDCADNIIAVSDLGAKTLSLWKVDETNPEQPIVDMKVIKDVSCNANPSDRVLPDGKCSFVSGVCFDANGWLLVADADRTRKRVFQIFDDNLNFITRLHTNAKMPYVSGIALTDRGGVMVCDRQDIMGGLVCYMLIKKEHGEVSVERVNGQMEERGEQGGRGGGHGEREGGHGGRGGRGSPRGRPYRTN